MTDEYLTPEQEARNAEVSARVALWKAAYNLGLKHGAQARHPTWCCQKCGENIGWLGRLFRFHRCVLR